MWILSKENEAKIPEWNKRWLEDVILRTKPMTYQDKLDVEKAIRAMYRLADLNVVFVRSPLEADVFATEYRDANNVLGRDNTMSYCCNASYLKAYHATFKESKFIPPDEHCFDHNTAHDITANATLLALYTAVNVPFYEAIFNTIYKKNPLDWDARDGGNLYSHRCAYISFVKDIIGFKCEEHENYKHYETCTKLSGPRYLYDKFCIISDFPTELNYYTRNGQLVAHNDKGPSHLWSDGFAIWTINGVAVTEQIVLNPKTLTIKQIDAEKNEEVKRVMIDRFGWTRYITETNAECLDVRINDIDGTSEALMALKDKSIRLLCACKSTARVYAIGVDKKIRTCQEAQSWMSGEKKINVIGVS